MISWINFVGFVLVSDFYVFQSLKTFTKNKMAFVVYWLFSLAILANFTYRLATFNFAQRFLQTLKLAFGLLVLSIIQKIIALLIFLTFPGHVGIWPEITLITLKNKPM